MRKPFTTKLGLSLLGLLPFAGLHAQSFDAQQAFAKALEVRSQWAGPGYPAADLRLSSAYADGNDLTHVYVQQLFRGIPVYNKMQSLAFVRGRLANHAGSFVPAKEMASQSATPTLTAAAAIGRALQHLGRPFAVAPARLTEEGGPEARQTFAAAGMAKRDIVTSLTWAVDEAGKPHLAWNVNIELLNSIDWWNVRVDAATGAVIGKDNWTVEEAAMHRAASAAGTVATTASAKAARLMPPPPPPSATGASFLVVPFPRENPTAFGVQTETDPWVRAGVNNNATTHGWNFDGTTNYSLTRGNNVSAYDDAANTNAPGNYATSQTASPSLSFAYPPDFTAAPRVVGNRNAAVVNLFYWNNIVHDVTYQYGFTEAAGNFQADNLGRGGRGGDYVKAEAQDGSGTNNANFNTPPDGGSGRMQMYLFNPGPSSFTVQVTAPSSVAGTYAAAEGAISANNGLNTLGPISGELALYVDGGTAGTSEACGPHVGAPLTGKIAVLYRGTCSYPIKVKNAQLAGAIAVVVINSVGGAPTVMTGTDNTITIPAVMVSQATGALLAPQIANHVQIVLPRNSPNPQLDGDYDSGIMVHEFTHGISNRLTGGPAAASCLNNAEQGGEGWSDYVALMLTTDWTTAQVTDGTNARPVGNYAIGQAATGRGIRRYPYSTSLSINPLTYANVATNTEVHNIGEVWCEALWDMTWSVIQQRGVIEPNLYNGAGNGGNNVALQLVMQGMKLQVCQPGFLDARDAILAADSLLYQGQYHCSIWRAFARRGMGYSAQEGLSTSATDQTAAFDMPPAVTLSKLPTTLVLGNTFSNEYKLTCNCNVPTAPYTLTDQLPAGMQFVSSNTGGTLVGNRVTFSNITFTAPGQTQNLRFQAQATTAGACAPVLPVNDNREASLLGGFVAQPLSGTATWAVSSQYSSSPTNSWWASPPATPTDFVLTSTPFTPVGLSVLTFNHYFDFEGSYDGGTVEISADNGATWLNTTTMWIENGYNGRFDASTTGAGLRCFSGHVGSGTAFVRSALDLRSFVGTPLLIRFRTRTDSGSPQNYDGWFVDDIKVLNGCGGEQVVELRDGSNTLQGTQTVVTYLLPVTVSAQTTGLAQASEFTAQPNPFGSQGLQLRLSLPSAQPSLALSLYDVTGRLLLQRSVEHVASGASFLRWNEAAGLPAGLYLVRIKLPDGSSSMLRVERE